jgi:hypothetical protein
MTKEEKSETRDGPVLSIGVCGFEIVSDFVLRISDFDLGE